MFVPFSIWGAICSFCQMVLAFLFGWADFCLLKTFKKDKIDTIKPSDFLCVKEQY